MKYCKDCKWSRPLPELPYGGQRYMDNDDLLCAFPIFCNPATGNPFRSCVKLRVNEGVTLINGQRCGMEARLFEEKS